MYMLCVNAAAGNRAWNPYDIILSCKLGDLCDDEASQKRGSPGQWTCTFNPSQDLPFPMDEWAGHVVGILGQYNRGKTWIMSRLSNCQLAKEGMTVRTEGISLKWVETTGDDEGDREPDKFHHLVIDTAGFNTPITLSGVQTGKSCCLCRMYTNVQPELGSSFQPVVSPQEETDRLDLSVSRMSCSPTLVWYLVRKLIRELKRSHRLSSEEVLHAQG